MIKIEKLSLIFYALSTREAGSVIFTCPFIKLNNKHALSLSDSQWSNRARMSLNGPDFILTNSFFLKFWGLIRPSLLSKDLIE